MTQSGATSGYRHFMHKAGSTMKSCRGKVELVQQYSSMEINPTPVSQHTQINQHNTAEDTGI